MLRWPIPRVLACDESEVADLTLTRAGPSKRYHEAEAETSMDDLRALLLEPLQIEAWGEMSQCTPLERRCYCLAKKKSHAIIVGEALIGTPLPYLRGESVPNVSS